MDNTNDPLQRAKVNLIGAACAVQKLTGAAATMTPIPGDDRVIVVGTKAHIARLLELAPTTPASQAPVAQAVPEGFVIAPHFRGYAHLGIGAYVLNHSAKGEPAELVISIATEEEKAGRTVGDTRDNAPDAVLQPEAMAVRLRFENVAGLDALEQQLRFVREAHFAAPAAPTITAASAPNKHGVLPIPEERKHAEESFTATEPRAAIGSPDWGMYWAGWLARSTLPVRIAVDAEASAQTAPGGVREQWISVDERLPEDEVPVLAYGAKRTEWSVMQRISGEWNIETASDFHSSYAPKFWMPLPEAPGNLKGQTGAATQDTKGGDK